MGGGSRKVGILRKQDFAGTASASPSSHNGREMNEEEILHWLLTIILVILAPLMQLNAG